MKQYTIQIDEDIFQWLQELAEPLVDSSSDVLRKIRQQLSNDEGPTLNNNLRFRRSHNRSGAKQLKAKLAVLVKSGLLQEGQSVYLHDYSGNRLGHHEANIEGNHLRYNGQTYSMSNLARKLLKEHSYTSDNVRGPIFWFTEDGTSIKEHWQLHLG